MVTVHAFDAVLASKINTFMSICSWCPFLKILLSCFGRFMPMLMLPQVNNDTVNSMTSSSKRCAKKGKSSSTYN